jgi:lysophospholipase L1-like esterase
MKKIFTILLMLMPIIIQAQVTKAIYFIEQNTLPSNPSSGTMVFYNDTMRFWSGTAWLKATGTTITTGDLNGGSGVTIGTGTNKLVSGSATISLDSSYWAKKWQVNGKLGKGDSSLFVTPYYYSSHSASVDSTTKFESRQQHQNDTVGYGTLRAGSVTNARAAKWDAMKLISDSISKVTGFTPLWKLDQKVDKVTGKSLSANDLTNALKTHYDSTASGYMDTMRLKSNSTRTKIYASGGNLYQDGYLIKSTNTIVQINSRGLSEYLGNTYYGTLDGVCSLTKIITDIQVNVISGKFYIVDDSVEIRIYSSPNKPTGTMPTGTLIFSKHYAKGTFNTTSTNFMDFNLSTSILLSANYWVAVYAFKLGTNKPRMLYWTSDSYGDRNYFFIYSGSSPWTSSWSAVSYPTYCCTPLVFKYNADVSKSYVDSIAVAKQNVVSIDPYMPDTIFSSKSKANWHEFNLYKDAYSNLRPDYQVEFISTVGRSDNRQYRDTATVTGNSTLTANIYDENLTLLKTKSCIFKKIDTVHVSQTGKIILCIGNSTTAGGNWVTELNSLLTKSGDVLTFLGTKGTAPNKHLGISGATFATFVGTSSRFYIGGRLDVKKYCLDSCSSAALDYVIIELGINDCFSATEQTTAQTAAIVTNALTLVTAIRNATYGFPNCKILIGLTTICTTDADACAANYGSTMSPVIFEKNVRALHKALSAQFLNTSKTLVVPVFYGVDRIYGYDYNTTTKACARCTQTITHHTNMVHPTTVGFNQMADIFYSYLCRAFLY